MRAKRGIVSHDSELQLGLAVALDEGGAAVPPHPALRSLYGRITVP